MPAAPQFGKAQVAPAVEAPKASLTAMLGTHQTAMTLCLTHQEMLEMLHLDVVQFMLLFPLTSGS